MAVTAPTTNDQLTQYLLGQANANNPLYGIGQLLTGFTNLGTAGADLGYGREAAGLADPWGNQRSQYQTQLNSFMGNAANNPLNATTGTTNALGRLEGLMQNPGQITSMPGYQFGMNQALEGVSRGAGASGLLNSGNRLTALEDRGQGYAHGWYDDVFNQMLGDVNANLGAGNQFLNAQGQGFGQLGSLAGVNAGSPTAAAQALLSGRANQAQSLGAGMGGIASGLTNLLPQIQKWLGGGGGGWGGATPGGANGEWDNVGGLGGGGLGLGGSNGGWDIGAMPIGSGGDYGLDSLFGAGDIFGGL